MGNKDRKMARNELRALRMRAGVRVSRSRGVILVTGSALTQVQLGEFRARWLAMISGVDWRTPIITNGEVRWRKLRNSRRSR